MSAVTVLDAPFEIDDEFKGVLPPLDEEERAGLEELLLAEGCRDALVVWNGLLIDGHNRFEICQRHGIPFQVVEREFEDRAAVRIWMRENQHSRRNLSAAWKIELALANKEDLKAKGRAKMADDAPKAKRPKMGLSPGDKPIGAEGAPQDSDTAPPRHNTREEIAKQAGVSTGQISMAEQVREKAPDLWENAKQGETSIKAAYQKIRKKEKKEQRAAEIEQQRKEIESGAVKLPEGVFEVVVMDPPWAYGRDYDPDGSRVANPYPEMTQEQLLAIEPPFADDAVLLLWTTHQFIWDAKQLLDHWGFTYKATIVWDKEKMGMGAWLRMQCEFCLLGVRGEATWRNTKWRDVIREARREHSRKPEAFYEMVEDCTLGRRLDYFAREARPGWEVFGNDTSKF